MSEDLLPFYNRELAHLRQMAGEFARAHPEVAANLRLSEDHVEDPHVERLIESSAFLNARIRHKLEDDFPELTNSLLQVLYPHYLAPIPSCAIAQLEPAEDLSQVHQVDPGTALESDRRHGEPCRFRTIYPVDLLPVRVAECTLTASPFEAPRTPHSARSVAVLRIVLEGSAEAPPLAELGELPLRFFLQGQPAHTYPLYELLLNNVVDIAVATASGDARPLRLAPQSIRPVGFSPEEGLLPYPKRSSLAYRLLTEYFAFPAKFLFLDLLGVDASLLERSSDRLELFFYLDRTSVDLQQNVDARTFALGCTPIVNLFQQRAEPVRLDRRHSEIHVVPDARRRLSMEVYSIDGVAVTDSTGQRRECRPFYGIDHSPQGEDDPIFWNSTRRGVTWDPEQPDHGTEVYLQLADLHFNPSSPSDSVLSMETTCLNRDLPAQLPFGGDQPRLMLSDGAGPVGSVHCLTPPTPTYRPEFGDGARWRLISHLSLNHLSISGGSEGAEALREILRLYEGVGAESNRAVIESILSVESEAVTLRLPTGRQTGFARGTEIRLEVDEQRFATHGLYLFCSVLEAFLGMNVSINTFVQLAVSSNRREGEAFRWPPRAGNRPLL